MIIFAIDTGSFDWYMAGIGRSNAGPLRIGCDIFSASTGPLSPTPRPTTALGGNGAVSITGKFTPSQARMKDLQLRVRICISFSDFFSPSMTTLFALRKNTNLRETETPNMANPMRESRNTEHVDGAEGENFDENPRKLGISTVELQGIGRCISV